MGPGSGPLRVRCLIPTTLIKTRSELSCCCRSSTLTMPISLLEFGLGGDHSLAMRYPCTNDLGSIEINQRNIGRTVMHGILSECKRQKFLSLSPPSPRPLLLVWHKHKHAICSGTGYNRHENRPEGSPLKFCFIGSSDQRPLPFRKA